MSLEDPFFVVKGEVQKAVNTARGLYQRWTELLQEEALVSKEELDWTTNELRNSLRSIEWDLEDLEETIGIVESNPRKFKIEGDEVAGRRAFVESTRDTVREMKDHISSPSAVAKTERKSRQALLGGGPSRGGVQADRYTLLDQDLGNSRYIEDQQAQQQLIVEQQDEQLELVSGSIRVLKNMSGRIGDELDEQAVPTAVVCHRCPGCDPGGGAHPTLHSVIVESGLERGVGRTEPNRQTPHKRGTDTGTKKPTPKTL
ncbi:syntaxin-6-like isoform X1 [Acipenser ruthenus]|uniref:syntaxin-6-like isoform X1 n=1 Tax=Acipenser ruthenus TaxID=7906 RepID=UPI0027416467|nr:syntaxin-6-like isoform X1 [Acipenser ruthenus]